jgi:serpin B
MTTLLRPLLLAVPSLALLVGCPITDPQPWDVSPPIPGEVDDDDDDAVDDDDDGPGDELHSDLPRDMAPQVGGPDLDALVGGNSDFALDLYGGMADEPGNLFFSPHSISVALAMTYAGANGNTESEMAAALSFDLPEPLLHQAFNALDLDLASRAAGTDESDGFQLNIVNALWGQEGFPFEQLFLDVLAVNYDAGLRVMDFVGAPDPSREEINDWVAEQTEDRIEDLLPPGSIDSMTRLVLTNAIYFNAAWEAPFEVADTADGDFFLRDGGSVTAPLMNGTQIPGAHAEGDGWQLIEIPYDDVPMSMTVVVPDAGRFDEIEDGFDADFLADALAVATYKELDLTMPSFEFEDDVDLIPELVDLGMIDAFDPIMANLTGICPTSELFISAVLHKAFVSVNEAGTEAAAATAVVVSDTGVPPTATVVLDRPFLFVIRDQPTGAILFVGRLLDPTA